MKTAINRTKMITMGLITIFIMGFTQPAISQVPLFNEADQNPIELKAIGPLNKQPLFQLNVNNTEAGEFLVKVKDAIGVLLYSETLKGKNIWRKYRLDVSEEDLDANFKVSFEITNVKTRETFVYNATRNSRVIEEVVVAKL